MEVKELSLGLASSTLSDGKAASTFAACRMIGERNAKSVEQDYDW